MSDSTAAQEAANSSKKVSKVSEAVIRIAGNSQDGIQSIGGFLARLAGRSEREVMTFMTIPSTISGGPSIFQVRIGSGEVLSSGDEADVLLAFYQHSYENHVDFLKEDGIVLYDSDHVEPNPEWQKKYRHVGCAVTALTVESIGGTARDKGKNIFSLGLIARMFDLNAPKLETLIIERFHGKAASISTTALTAFHAGYAYPIATIAELYEFTEAQARDKEQVVTNGNEALGYGILAAGVRFGAGYPITPWSSIMELLRRELPKYGGIFVQAEDELAAIAITLGASYAGHLAVTGSSGPGLSLKAEALGYACMAELPLLVVNVQRGGPSTGLPTSVEPVKEIAEACRNLKIPLLYDGAHVLGLILGGCFQDPFREGAHFINASTHKTFPGPQRGVILGNLQGEEELKWWTSIDRGVMPGSSSSHHLHTLPGLVIAIREMKVYGKAYAKQTINNAKALGQALDDEGVDVEAKEFGFTESHQLALRVTRYGEAKKIARHLAEQNIICNYNQLPGDPDPRFPSGLRLGVQEMTRMGMTENEMEDIAQLMSAAIKGKEVLKEVGNLRERFNEVCYC